MRLRENNWKLAILKTSNPWSQKHCGQWRDYFGRMSKIRSEFRQNNRERRRQLHVNEAFNQLRQIIPCYPINKKMSKQEILRGAIRYLRILEYLLGLRTTYT